MLFRSFTAALLIIQLVTWWNAAPITVAQSSAQVSTDNFHLYLPTVGHQLPLQLGVRTNSSGDVPPLIFAYGYLLNTSTEPLYAATLQATVIRTEGDCCGRLVGVYTDTYTVSPAFTSTLPGQPNPFSLMLWSSRSTSYRIESVIIHTARNKLSTDPTYVALDASSWVTGSTSLGCCLITGTVRNNTPVPVRDVRGVVISDVDYCVWREAPLLTTTLQVGESTTYHDDMCIYRFDPPILVLAQGVVSTRLP